VGDTRSFDPSKNLPEHGSSICSDQNCPRCHGTGKCFVLDVLLPITKWTLEEHPDPPVPILKKQVVSDRAGPFDSLNIPTEYRNPGETRISMELKHFLDERR
jgi:hypothetical protein